MIIYCDKYHLSLPNYKNGRKSLLIISMTILTETMKPLFITIVTNVTNPYCCTSKHDYGRFKQWFSHKRKHMSCPIPLGHERHLKTRLQLRSHWKTLFMLQWFTLNDVVRNIADVLESYFTCRHYDCSAWLILVHTASWHNPWRYAWGYMNNELPLLSDMWMYCEISMNRHLSQWHCIYLFSHVMLSSVNANTSSLILSNFILLRVILKSILLIAHW